MKTLTFIIACIAFFLVQPVPVMAVEHKLIVTMHKLEPFVIVRDARPTSGFIVEIFAEMAKSTGHSGKVRLSSFVRALKGLEDKAKTFRRVSGTVIKQHRAHLIVARTAKREARFKWVGPILYDGTVIYQRSDDTRKFNSLEDIKQHGAICTIQRKVSETELFAELGIPYYEVYSQEEAVTLLLKPKSRFDCTPIAIMNTQAILERAGFHLRQLKSMKFQLKAHQVYMAFSLSTPDSVITRWQQALDRLSSTGKRMALIQKYVPFYNQALEQKLIASQRAVTYREPAN